jgi:hypothetical protein
MKYIHPQPKNHFVTVVGIGILLTGAFFTYDYFSAKSARAQDGSTLAGDQGGLVSTGETNGIASPLSPEQQELLNKITSLKLEGKILSDPIFRSLHDWEVKIEPQEVGKLNPFAPFSGAARVATSTTRR